MSLRDSSKLLRSARSFGFSLLALGLLHSVQFLEASANPYKMDRQADLLRDSRKGVSPVLRHQQAKTAWSHRKAILDALDREKGRDLRRKPQTQLRVPPRKSAERTNSGFSNR